MSLRGLSYGEDFEYTILRAIELLVSVAVNGFHTASVVSPRRGRMQRATASGREPSPPGVGRRDRSFAASRPRTVNRRAPSRAKPRNSNRRRSRRRITSCPLAARQGVCTETNYSDFAAKKPLLD